MKSFLKTVVPIAVLMLLDMASFEIFTVIAGRFGEDQLAVHVAFANTIGTYYCIPLGLSVTIMTFVANSMGEGSVNALPKITPFVLLGLTFLQQLSLWEFWQSFKTNGHLCLLQMILPKSFY